MLIAERNSQWVQSNDDAILMACYAVQSDQSDAVLMACYAIACVVPRLDQSQKRIFVSLFFSRLRNQASRRSETSALGSTSDR